MWWILFLVYGFACTLAFVIGVGPTNSNPRKWYWWERVLTFPVWALAELSNRIPFLAGPIYVWMNCYALMCYPLAWLHDQYELWQYNRKNKK